jgi:hypothetical protein
MLQRGRETDLPLESLGPERRRYFGKQNLERHRPVMLEIAGQIDDRHAAATELALKAIAVSKGVGERGRQIGQGETGVGDATKSGSARRELLGE